MSRYLRVQIRLATLVFVSISILLGCGAPATNTQQPKNNLFQADLTAVQSTVKVFKGGDTETDVQQDQTISVQANDRIEVEKESRSILKFPNVLEAELLRNAIVLLTDVRQETGGSTNVSLSLKQGHMFVRLSDSTISQVTVETPYSTIKTLEDGTEFDVCHNEVLTCVWVKKGSAEVIGQSKKQILNTGEASYIKKDQPPSPAICAPIATFVAWEENYRRSADTPLLGEVVSQLPQEPCPVPITGSGPSPTPVPSLADLTVKESSIKVFKGGDSETDVQQNGTVGVQVNDRIELAQDSRAILDFPQILNVELFRNAILLLEDAKQESGKSTDITLNLDKGHIFVRQDDTNVSQLTVKTIYATIKTLERGTEFDVCHNDKLTCVWVKKGAVDIVAKDKKETVKGGEASYILMDQPPSAAICAPIEIFADWEENYRKVADTPALGKLVSDLPQEPCTSQDLTLPADAHILYQDDFANYRSGWPQGKIDNASAGYSVGEYYDVQILKPNFKYSVFVPGKAKYKDVNIDLNVFTLVAKDGDFQYGLIFRRSGDQYYAFTISPSTKKWYVLKSSPDALKTLKEGTDEDIRGLQAIDTLRVSAKGSTFFFRINGRLIYQISDPDYAEGEVGLFVQTEDSPNALIRFDSITIWDIKPPFIDPTPGPREICFNNKDDDGDKLIDRADPDCNRKDALPAPTATPGSITPPTSGPPACTPPEQDPQCPDSNPYDPSICDCGAFVPGGCTDPNATNFDPKAPYDDGSCEYAPPPVSGCTDPNATNYDPSATVDDGSCTYPPPPPTDIPATNPPATDPPVVP